ncbi:MAG: DUF1330 domain-containing protein [Pseudomonadales bacterium]|jgi:uncharacterized protein (DUF1330 family)
MTKPAYLVVCIDVHDEAAMQPYGAGAMPILDAYEATVLSATNRIEIDHGTWPRARAVVIEFPSLARAQEFWASPEYQPLKVMREAASEADIVLVEGILENRIAATDGIPHFLLGASTVSDPGWVEEYMQKVPPVSAKFGVQALASGGEFEVLDGTWSHSSMVLLGFPSEQVFRDFWYGPEYRPMKELREANSSGDHISFPGVVE